ncbi:hypothetical protein GCM10023205_83740 [Yinghuangia aomiensis]|uniref:Uncharacterized protein n=1 Tax=Yinghuangia aomiensis TaxID=676205 RepID=A0ABP9II48_9ACTN
MAPRWRSTRSIRTSSSRPGAGTICGCAGCRSGTFWDDALVASNQAALADIWDDVIAELDSDWGAYTYVSHLGPGA